MPFRRAVKVLAAAALSVWTALVPASRPAMADSASAPGASAVVVGRRGLGNAASALVGSVSNRLATEARCPVIVVGESQAPATGPIVVGVDGSEFGTAALRFALHEAALRQTSVRAVAAFDFLHPVFRSDPELARRMQAGTEAEVADTITTAHRAATSPAVASVEVEQVVVEGRAAEAIVDNAGDAQLIVVGTHGKGLVRRVLLGSVSRQVLNDADRPVAVVDHHD